jgi:hypothetical protein
MENYKYDVAFSFLDEDKSLVFEVNELLKDRLNTFAYFERQDELVGNDGEEEFNRVFGEEARIVVVFYKKNWGNKGFTRIEKNAIKKRAFRGDDHYNFILLVNLEDTSPEISWIPITNIYFSIKQYGVDALAAIIENMVIQNGGKVHEETPLELAARVERRRNAEQKRKDFLNSVEGVRIANNEFQILCEKMKEIAELISSQSNLYNCEIDFSNDLLMINCCATTFYCHWLRRAINTLHGYLLEVSIVGSRSRFSNERQKDLYKEYYVFDKNLSEQIGWHEKENEKKFYLSEQLADLSIKIFLQTIDNEIARREKNQDDW